MKLLEVVWLPAIRGYSLIRLRSSASPEVLMLTLVRHLSFSRFSPLGELRPPFVLETCIGLLDFGTSTGGREGVSTYTFVAILIEFIICAMVTLL